MVRRRRKNSARRSSLTARLMIGGLVAAIGAALLWDDVVVVVKSGETGVLWSRFAGTRLDQVYEERIYFISPFDRMYRYETRKQIAMHQLDILSVEGLTLKLDLAIRYRPILQTLAVLHDRIGPDYLNRVVIPQAESVIRKELSNATAEDIHTNRDNLLTRAILLAMEEAGRNFVEIEDIIIRRIDLPETVREAIQQKLRAQELLKSYAFRTEIARLEAERLRIEANGVRDYYATVDDAMNERVMAHQEIETTLALASSEADKTVVMGATTNLSLPLFLPQAAMPKGEAATPQPSTPMGQNTPLAKPAKLTP